jgi:hypothetical protein
MAAVIHICVPTVCGVVRRVMRCHKCKTKRLHILLQYEWYDADAHCLTCCPKYKTMKSKPFELV